MSKIDFEYGLQYSDDAQITDFKNPLIKFRNNNLKSQILLTKPVLTNLTILPVDLDCDGSCEFCYEKNMYNSNKVMSLFDLNNQLSKLKNSVEFTSQGLFKLKFFGGDPFKHPDLFSIISYTIDFMHTIDTTFKFIVELYLDGFWKNLTYVKNVINNVCKLESVISIKLLSNLDFGSNLRYSQILNLTAYDSIQNIFDVINNIYSPKILKIHKIYLTLDTNLNRLIDDFNNVKNDTDCFRFKIILDRKLHPSIPLLDDFYNTFNKSLISNIPMYMFTYKNNLTKQMNTPMIPINENISIFDVYPMIHRCPMGITGITFNKDTFFRGVFHCYKIKDLMYITPTSNVINSMCTVPKHCLTCEYYNCCSICNLHRYKFSCLKFDYIKHWIKLLAQNL